MSKVRARVAILALSFGLVAAACGGSDASTATSKPQSGSTVVDTSTAGSAASGSQSVTSTTIAPTKSILELAKAEGSLTTLLRLLDVAGLTSTLQGSGPFSLVAPTDAAFAKMDPTTLDKISKNPAALTALLQYHVVAARITTNDVAAGFVKTMEGSTLALQATTKLPTVNGLRVTRGAKATNGTILVVESVLIPVDLKLP